MFEAAVRPDLLLVQFGTLDWHEMAKFAVVVAVVLLTVVRLALR
jgi:hypothetical protein